MRRHHETVRLAGLLLTAILPCGCARHSTVVGTWKGATQTPQGATAQIALSLTTDGRETMVVQINSAGSHTSLVIGGTYTVSRTSLTQTITSATFNGKTMPLPPQSRSTETDQFTLNGDTLTLTKPGSATPLILTRQKS